MARRDRAARLVAVLVAASLLGVTVAGGGAAGAALVPPPPLVWAQAVAGAGDDNASGVATDAAGNAYVTGKFGGTATWGDGAAAVTRSAVGGSRDAYLARYDPDGTLAWVVTAGGTGYDEGRDVVADKAGNLYVTGSFMRTATFGDGPTAVTLTSAASETGDVFLAKYDAATGALRWVVQGGGPGNDVGYGVSLDNAGNPILSGQFSATATFAGRTLTAVGGTDVVVARYTAAGALQWAVRAGGTGNEYGAAAAMDAQGNIHVVGPFTGSGFWGWGAKLTSVGGTDGWLATWGPNGVLVRAQRFGGPGADNALGVVVDASGEVYVAGSFSGTATIGAPGVAEELVSAGATDALLARFAGTGDLVWAERAGGPGGDLASVVTLDATAAPVVTGTFVGPAGFGAGADAVVATSSGGTDVFVARHDTGGSLSWLTTAGGSGGDVGLGVATAADGSVTAVGLSTSGITFPSGAGSVTLPATGIRDVYVARFGP